MRIGLITTLETNIGDDFIREGICLVLKEVFKNQRVEFVPINKHRPMTIYPKWHPCHWTEYIPYGRRYAYSVFGKVFYKFGNTLFDDCDLIVQCGAPVLWPNCYRCEWAEPLWHQVVGRLHNRTPVLNLAAGSCYPWEEQPTRINNSFDTEYLKTILSYCRITTSRDTLAHSLFASLGSDAPHIPCSGFLAAGNINKNQESDNLVLINYMEGGGHYDWNQHIDKTFWRNTVKHFIDRIGKRHRIAFLCHTQNEYNLAKNIDPSLERIFPNTLKEYFSLASKAKAALCNRLHASVGLAGIGIPSVSVGTDTRLLMVSALNLPYYYVKDVNVDMLENDIENLMESRSKQQDRLFYLKAETLKSYIKIVSKALEYL